MFFLKQNVPYTSHIFWFLCLVIEDDMVINVYAGSVDGDSCSVSKIN